MTPEQALAKLLEGYDRRIKALEQGLSQVQRVVMEMGDRMLAAFGADAVVERVADEPAKRGPGRPRKEPPKGAA